MYCNNETKNPKFCNSSCAASYNNRAYVKRKPQHKCKMCAAPINARKIYCSLLCKKSYVRHKKEVTTQRIAEGFLVRKPNKEAVSDRRRKIKSMAIEFMGGSCILCGYNKCHRALVFHHIDPSTKEFGVGSKGLTRSWEKTKKELVKCVLLCHNCHCEVHDGLLQLPE